MSFYAGSAVSRSNFYAGSAVSRSNFYAGSAVSRSSFYAVSVQFLFVIRQVLRQVYAG